MSEVERLPVAERPRFARKMIAVWRLHHVAAGEELSVTVAPGEWPADVPHEVKGVPVHEHEHAGGPGGMLVLGRVGDVWRAAYNLAITELAAFRPQDLAICTAFIEVDRNRDIKLWLHPSPETGEVPMWQFNRGADHG